MTVTVIRRVGGNYWEGRQDISGEGIKVIRRYQERGQKSSGDGIRGTKRRDKSDQKKKQ